MNNFKISLLRIVFMAVLSAPAWCFPPTCAAAAAQEVPFHGKSRLRFATAKQGAEVLRRRDSYIKAMSRFDRESRLQKVEGATEEAFLDFVSSHALDWNEQQIAAVSAAAEAIRVKLDRFRIPFPETVLLVLTTGKEEGNAAYCRSNAIVLPTRMAAIPPKRLQRLLLHELFHILSRGNPQLRNQLYSIIGFQPCNEIEFPQALKPRKITNPDAPVLDHYITLVHEEKQIEATPILYASIEQFDPEKGGSFFKYLTFRLMQVEQKEGKWQAALSEGKPLLLDPKTNKSFHEQIGGNTKYIIHPDEILADNFVHLITGAKSLATPKIVEEMGKLLGQESAAP